MKKETIPVSVVIPCYKSSDTIERAVKSINVQSVLPLEIIIVDDFSNDTKTYEVLKEIEKNNNLIKILLLKKNAGPGSARNRGWEVAKGDYIAFLDSDDSWHPQKLEIQFKYMKNNLKIDLSSHYSSIFEGRIENLTTEDFKVESFKKFQFLFRNRIATRTVMLKTSLPMRFLENKRASEDFLLWCEIYLNGFQIRKINLVLAYSFKEHYGDSGLTANLKLMHNGQKDSFEKLFEKNLINNGIYKLLYYFSYVKYYRRKVIVYKREKSKLS